MTITIKTNNRPRPLVSWHDLPEKERDYFDYLDEDDKFSERFVHYKGWWYDAGDMMRVDTDTLKGWHAYQGDSYFSGVVIKLVDMHDGYGVICGTYFS